MRKWVVPWPISCVTWSRVRLHVWTMVTESWHLDKGPPLRQNQRMMWDIAKNSLSCMWLQKICKVFRTLPGSMIFLLRLIHVTLIYYAFVKPGVVMILNRGRRHWVINCSFPEVQPIVVLELALGESLLWNCLTSTFMLFLRGFARYTRQSSMWNFNFFLSTFRLLGNTTR